MNNEIIDDKWAAVWPRRWVMVRDANREQWKGPYRLLGRAAYCSWEYVTERGPFGQCRPATPEEIATVEPSAASIELPDPGPGWRWLECGESLQAWDEVCEKEKFFSVDPEYVGDTVYISKTFRRRIPIDEPQPNEQIAAKEPNPSAEMTRYMELKRLAEMAWVALLSSPTDGKAEGFAEFSWNAAEAMNAESEKRKPK